MTKRLIKAKTATREAVLPQTPTRAQLECLRAFERLYQKLGKSPTKRELSTELGLTESGAQGHLVQLTLKGYLEEEKELVVVGRKLTPLAKKLLGMLSG